MAHGREAAEAAGETARRAFEEGALAGGLPTVEIPRAELAAGIGLLAAFVTAGLCASNGEVRRQVKGGGTRVNDQPEGDEKRVLGEGDLLEDGVIKLSLGKKRHVLLKAV